MKIFIPILLADQLEKELSNKNRPLPYFKKDKLYYIISVVYSGYLINYFNESDSVVHKYLSSQLLQKILGKKYNFYINFLIEKNILRRTSGFKTGINSFGYSLPNLEHYGHTGYTITDMVIKRKLLSHFRSKNNLFIKKNEHLTKDFKYLMFNKEMALKFCRRVSQIKSKSNSAKDLRLKYKEKVVEVLYKDPTQQDAYSKFIINNFVEKQYRFKICTSNNRFNSILTLCPSVLRNFLSYKGQELVSIDLKNSQPYLLLILFNPKVNEKMKKIFYSIYNSNNQTSNHYPFTLSKTTHNIDLQEFIKYKTLLSNGNFYPYFFEKLGFESKDYSSLKKHFKKCVFGTLYSRNSGRSQFIAPSEKLLSPDDGLNLEIPYGKVGVKTIMSREFPRIYRVIRDLKRERYQNLALFLQRVESYLFLEVIIPLIRKQNKAIPLFPVHDSLITTPAHLEFVLNTMRDVLEEYVGVTPSFSIEQLNIDRADEYLENLVERGRVLPKVISIGKQEECYGKAA